MTRATDETVRLCLRAEAAVYPVYVPEAATERVMVLPSWDAEALRRGRSPLIAPRLGVRAQVRVKRRPSSLEEDPITTQIHVPEELPCRHHRRNDERSDNRSILHKVKMGFLPLHLGGL